MVVDDSGVLSLSAGVGASSEVTESCVGEHVDACAAVDLAGTGAQNQAACVAAGGGGGACTYTAADPAANPAVVESCVATDAATCAAADLTGDAAADATQCSGQGACIYNAATTQVPGANVAITGGSGAQGGGGGDVTLMGGADDDGLGGDIILQPGASSSGTVGRVLITDSAGTEVVRVSGSSVEMFGPLILNDDVELNSHNLVTTGQLSATTVVTPTLTTATANTVDLVTDMVAASTAAAETCTATYADECGAVDLSRADVATCVGTRQDNSDCADVAAFIASGLIADCPTTEGCVFTGANADELACLSAAACVYVSPADATCTGTRQSDSSNCADVSGFDGSAGTCPTDDECVYTAARTEGCQAIAASACAAADVSGVPSASQANCEAAGACTYTRGATGTVEFVSDINLLTNDMY